MRGSCSRLNFSGGEGMTGSVIKSVRQILQEIAEDICNNYCKYRDTADEEFLCDVIKGGGVCPLDRLN